MKLHETTLPGVVELTPARHGDDRGWFCETWNQATMAELGLDLTWVQDNESFSGFTGTIRGIHFQTDPFAQDKLVRAVTGTVLDVAVDLRRSSATFAQSVGVELSSSAGNQLLIPRGFGHAFCTLEPNCQVAYKVTSRYAPECDRSIRFDDPTLAIDWPVDPADAVVSDKDRDAPLLADVSIFD